MDSYKDVDCASNSDNVNTAQDYYYHYSIKIVTVIELEQKIAFI